MNSLQQSDAEAAAVAVAPRVTLADIEGAIVREVYATGDAFARMFDQHTPLDGPVDDVIGTVKCLTICLMVLDNGFTLLGKSAPAAPENFDPKLGEKFAREDCIRQAWPLFGFALRQRLHDGATA